MNIRLVLPVCICSMIFSSLIHSQNSNYSNWHDKKNTIPIIPIGLDSYRAWNLWPIQRIGDRAYMRSTYDRSGSNDHADAGFFLYMKEENNNVALDVTGKGILYFFRANYWHGSPWHFVTDGKDNIVEETATNDPVDAKQKISDVNFIPSKTFLEPLAYTWNITHGADLIWEPMAFSNSLRIAYSRTHYGTGYFIYHLYANENTLSRSIKTWNINKRPSKDVLQLINRAGTDIAPQNINKIRGELELNRDTSVQFADIKSTSSVIRAFKLTIPLEKAIELERLGLKVYWDDSSIPSIDAPLCLFFGAGTLYNRDHREYLVKGFPINIRYDYKNNKVFLACYYPMPFFKSARFELSGSGCDSVKINYEIRYERWNYNIDQSSYFHATYRDFIQPEAGKDMTFLDTYNLEDHKEWSGSFVGTSFIFSHDGILNTLEGDPRFYFDDSQSPQAYGTGTEEWAGGGDYWGGQNMTLPFAGHPCGAKSKNTAKDKEDLIESAYRFLLADLMPFGRRAVIKFEHGGTDLSTEHYEAVTFWYGLPAPSLIKTDELDVGNITSEKSHHYFSPQESPIEYITSRYEAGIDTIPLQPKGISSEKIAQLKDKLGKEVYPAHKEDGRFTRGISEFIIKLDKNNKGVLLRRTLDYSFPNQKAKIYIANISNPNDTKKMKWKYAGIWYLAGSNTCVSSHPKGELDKRVPHIETSDRRFRDDEFLIPYILTKGCKYLKVLIKFVPSDQELYPGVPFPKQSAWSELRYKVYSYIMPTYTLSKRM